MSNSTFKLGNLTFTAAGDDVTVTLEGNYVGDVKPVEGGWAYFPKGVDGRQQGETFLSLKGCMRSLA